VSRRSFTLGESDALADVAPSVVPGTSMLPVGAAGAAGAGAGTGDLQVLITYVTPHPPAYSRLPPAVPFPASAAGGGGKRRRGRRIIGTPSFCWPRCLPFLHLSLVEPVVLEEDDVLEQQLALRLSLPCLALRLSLAPASSLTLPLSLYRVSHASVQVLEVGRSVVVHSRPAVQLITLKTELTGDDLVRWHRPVLQMQYPVVCPLRRAKPVKPEGARGGRG